MKPSTSYSPRAVVTLDRPAVTVRVTDRRLLRQPETCPKCEAPGNMLRRAEHSVSCFGCGAAYVVAQGVA